MARYVLSDRGNVTDEDENEEQKKKKKKKKKNIKQIIDKNRGVQYNVQDELDLLKLGKREE